MVEYVRRQKCSVVVLKIVVEGFSSGEEPSIGIIHWFYPPPVLLRFGRFWGVFGRWRAASWCYLRVFGFAEGRLELFWEPEPAF